MRRTSGLEMKGNLISHVIEPVQQFFIFQGVNLLVDHIFRTPRGNQQEDMMCHGAKIDRQIQDFRDLVDIMSRHSSINLKLYAHLIQPFNTLKGSIKGPWHFPKLIMFLGACPIKGNAHPLNPRRLHSLSDLWRNQRPVGGHHHAQAQQRSVFGQLKDILSQQGLTARKDDDGLTHLCNLLQYLKTLFRVQFSSIRPSFSGSPTVDAIQVAASGHFPGHKPKLVLAMRMTFVHELIQ